MIAAKIGMKNRGLKCGSHGLIWFQSNLRPSFIFYAIIPAKEPATTGDKVMKTKKSDIKQTKIFDDQFFMATALGNVIVHLIMSYHLFDKQNSNVIYVGYGLVCLYTSMNLYFYNLWVGIIGYNQ